MSNNAENIDNEIEDVEDIETGPIEDNRANILNNNRGGN